MIGAASVNPDNFEVRFEYLSGRVLSVDAFSADERQLYALALLRARRRVSKRPLPLAVDAPVARLDEAHCWETR
jgi:DNA sulfur modification protein DndD